MDLLRETSNDLRHTFASLQIQDGEPLAYVKEQLAHWRIKMTVEVYGHLVPGASRQAVNRLPSLRAGNTESRRWALELKTFTSMGSNPRPPDCQFPERPRPVLVFKDLGSAEFRRISHFHRISAPQAHPEFWANVILMFKN